MSTIIGQNEAVRLPPAANDAERLTLVIGRLNRRLKTADGGLSHGLLSALAELARRGPMRLSDLAQIEGVSAPSMTRAVAELEARGLVSRSPDPSDGRAVLVEAAATATAAILEVRAIRSRVVAELLGELDSEDAATILAALPALERLTEQS